MVDMNPNQNTREKGIEVVLKGLHTQGAVMLFPYSTEQGHWYAKINISELANLVRFERRP
jgi:hypothetical protein